MRILRVSLLLKFILLLTIPVQAQTFTQQFHTSAVTNAAGASITSGSLRNTR